MKKYARLLPSSGNRAKEVCSYILITVSVGVSFNKVFAKLGSDMKKPDATTVITLENYRDKAWNLPVSDLLYVGPATTRKLNQYGITTIGELAQANPDLLYWLLGKNGIMLHQFANGQDHSGVRRCYAVPPMKSIGNSTTAPRDLVTLPETWRGDSIGTLGTTQQPFHQKF